MKENSNMDLEEEKKLEDDSQEADQEKEGSSLKAEIISWIKVVVFAVVLALFLGEFVIMNAYIPSGSMMDTLKIKDRVIGLRLAYLFDTPERFDVVMFKFPDNEEKDYIKRVIGLPGETVTLKNGKVYINDSKVPLDEPYVKGTPNGLGDGTYEVPEGCYFMMGDNRNESQDSRFWDNKFVEKDKILAKALFRWYPGISWIKTDY